MSDVKAIKDRHKVVPSIGNASTFGLTTVVRSTNYGDLDPEMRAMIEQVDRHHENCMDGDRNIKSGLSIYKNIV